MTSLRMLLIKALKPLVEVIRQELDAIGELLRVRHHPYLMFVTAITQLFVFVFVFHLPLVSLSGSCQ